MRVGAMVISLTGAMLGFLVAIAEKGIRLGMYFYFPQIKTNTWMDWLTFFFSAVALLAAIISWKWPRAAMGLLALSIVGGIAGALTVWELPGAFLFTGLILLFISQVGLHDDEFILSIQVSTSEGVPDEALK
ncbi:hypothetical protein [Sulfoacidibacillus thermotolerans]|uniref:Uncharacterized protein n=1 Tax=Sulfoacidibacillus thermotolerans TaxID=1765684 RepID=A0A2U3D802_SULT2|nr:hypothetical protein [Sulfoacidibacillus thermotolerans]PWI57402.1 hypothetical protein BM613_08740 [Sulfoacidibacillus thermotolerans]